MESAKAMKRLVQMRLWLDVEWEVMMFHMSDDKASVLLLPAAAYCHANGVKACHQSNLDDRGTVLAAASALSRADMIVTGDSARSVLVRQVLGDTLLATLGDNTTTLFLAQ